MSQACGELYCSISCRDAHWARGHCFLCVGPIPEQEAGQHPLVLFKMHAGKYTTAFVYLKAADSHVIFVCFWVYNTVRTNEIFLLVADVVVSIITRFQANGGDLQRAMEVCVTDL